MKAVDAPAAGPVKATAARVLLVDDSRAVRTLVRLYLSARGLEFIETGSAEEALHQLGREPVDLVITDYNMPGLKGVGFTEALRAHALAQVRSVPVVMLTSDASPVELRRQASAAGVSAFLRKPITGPELLSVVDGLLAARPARVA
ncbi:MULTISPECIES: response regulator [Myxococcaceae]|uniref:response regulator n=1 Tax=Myxococcaceae TaxID=31 RepID=UPI0018902122|nr:MULTISPECIES: response regulator [Myxococcaceae]MBF5044343.1 response regulator [Simulacricoccus sp. 17bor-14]